MLKNILIGLAGLVIVLLLIIASRPAEFAVERSGEVPGPPEVAYSLVDDFHAWAAWSPWEKMDPGMQRTFEGADSGVGAIYRWSGSPQVGKGRMEITETTPHEKIVLALEFQEPMQATNTTTFTFAPSGDATRVTWSMRGRNGFVGKALSLVFDMDQMVGPDFERGLADMKTAADGELARRRAEDSNGQARSVEDESEGRSGADDE